MSKELSWTDDGRFPIIILVVGFIFITGLTQIEPLLPFGNSSPSTEANSFSTPSSSSGGSWENGGKGKRVNGEIPEFAECARRIKGNYSSLEKGTRYCCSQIGGSYKPGKIGGECYK